MTRTIVIKNGSVILKDRVLHNGTVAINGGKVSSLGRSGQPASGIEIDAAGCYVSPGFIDSHIHGDPSEIIRNEVKYGTTSLILAESCASLGRILKRARRLRKMIRDGSLGSAILGFRMEGPYISSKKAGAQDARYIRKPDTKELARLVERCGPLLKMMTIAPELKGSGALIRLLRKNGIVASVGHSYATCGQAKRGISSGIRHATHLFNAMRASDGRDGGVVGAVLSDKRVYAEAILDLVHIDPALFGRAVRAKGLGKVILVTDSVKAGRSRGVKKSRGAYRFRDGRLAGSALTMIEAVKNAVAACGLRLPDAVRLASLNPATALGIGAKKGSIATGKDADIAIFDKDFNVKMTIVRGKIAYRKRGF